MHFSKASASTDQHAVQGSGADVKISNVFTEKLKSGIRVLDALPKVAPTATLTQVEALLKANGLSCSAEFAKYTVHSVVNELLQFLCCKTWEVEVSCLVESVAEKVVQVLVKCDSAALDAVADIELVKVPTVAPAEAAPVSVKTSSMASKVAKHHCNCQSQARGPHNGRSSPAHAGYGSETSCRDIPYQCSQRTDAFLL